MRKEKVMKFLKWIIIFVIMTVLTPLIIYATETGFVTDSATNKEYYVNMQGEYCEVKALQENVWITQKMKNYKPIYWKFTLKEQTYVTFEGDGKVCYLWVYKKTYNQLGQRTAAIPQKLTDQKYTIKLNAGTYYLCIDKTIYSAGKVRVTFETKSEVNKVSPSKTTSKYSYVKIKAKQTGYIYFYLNSEKNKQVVLCNKSKKVIGKTQYFGELVSKLFNKRYAFAVQKNQTYYLRIKGLSSSAEYRYTYNTVSEKSGSSKTKAVEIKSGKIYSGLILPSNSTADWYKIKLTTAKKIRFVCSNSNSIGKIKMSLYNSKNKIICTKTIVSKQYSWGNNIVEMELPKGTYYVKIYRADAKSSGNYNIYWDAIG